MDAELDRLTRHVRGLARLAGEILHDAHAGEDVAQEAVVRALSAGRQPARDVDAGPWLRTIARRLAFNERAARAARADREQSHPPGDPAPSTEELVARAETAERLHAAIRALPAELSAALIDRYVGDLSPSEIAARDGVSVHTVKDRLRRAKAVLRTRLDAGELGTDRHWSATLAPLALFGHRAAAPKSALVSITGIAITMKLATAVAFCLAIVVAFVAMRSGGGSEREPRTIARDDAGRERIAALDQAAAEPSPQRAPAMFAADEPLAPKTLTTRLYGRVLDTARAPLPRVRVRVDRTRREGVGVTELPTIGTLSAEDGTWELLVPVEDVIRTTVLFVPSKFRVMEELTAGTTSLDELPPFDGRDVSTGDVILTAAGAAQGRVVNDAGEPIEGVKVEVAPDISAGYGLVPHTSTTTGADGTFVLGHAAIGILGVRFLREGYVGRFLPHVRFEREAETDLGTITLATARTLRGRVVDELGVPAAGVGLYLKPVEHGQERSYFKTRSDGTFEVALQSDCGLKVWGYPVGFHRPGESGEPEILIEPEETQVEIALRRMVLENEFEFRVVDATTGEPVESYGLAILPNAGSKAENRVSTLRSRSQYRSRPNGVARAVARPGIDIVRIQAPGYLQYRKDVEEERDTPGVDRIALERGTPIVGRVFSGALPAADVRVLALKTTGRTGETEQVDATVTGADGRYRFQGVEPGSYEVALVGEGSARVSVSTSAAVPTAGEDRPIVVAGDLHVEPVLAGSVRGRVIPPVGFDLEGACVFFDGWSGARPTPVRPNGAFEITDVAPGAHTLHVAEIPGRLVETPSVGVHVVSGEAADCEVDLSDCGATLIELTVTVPGVDPTSLRVMMAHELLDPDATGDLRGSRRRSGMVPFERLDADGRVKFTTRASGVGFIVLERDDMLEVVLPEPRFELTPGAQITRSIRFDPSSMVLEVPDSWSDESGGSINLQFRAVGHRVGVQRGVPGPPVAGASDGDSPHVVTVDFLPPGRFEVIARKFVDGGRRRSTATFEVVLEAGRVTAATLPEAAWTEH